MTALEKITVAHMEEFELIDDSEMSARSIKARYQAELKSMLTAYFAQINMSDAKWRVWSEHHRIPATDSLYRTATAQVKKPLKHFSRMLDQKEYESYSDRNLDVLLRSTWNRCRNEIDQTKSRLTLTKFQQCFKTAIILHLIKHEGFNKRSASLEADGIVEELTKKPSQTLGVPGNLKDLEEIQGSTKKLYSFKSR